jgi:hypothetical protein
MGGILPQVGWEGEAGVGDQGLGIRKEVEPVIPTHAIDGYTAMPYNSDMVFIETTVFTKLVYNYLSDEEFIGLQNYLMNHPDAGDVIPGSGGVRKLRWRIQERGERGGIRVIYYWRKSRNEIWLITLYAKNEASTISPEVLRRIAEEIKHG